MDIFLLITGIGLILGGANFLTDGAAALAQRFRVPEFIIGLTVISIGTSTPELVISILSTLAGHTDVAIGNVIGSNVFNILVILGVCALIAPVVLTSENIRRDIPLGLAAALILLAVTFHLSGTGRISRIEGITMLALYFGGMWYTVRNTSRPAEREPGPKKHKALWLILLLIAGGLTGLIAGGEFFLRSATSIARRLGVSESVIAITLVAGGTSLPELASSVVSVLKGRAEMALGNVIGSNVANILLILGVGAAIHPLSMGGITMIDIGIAVFSAALLFASAFTFRRRKLDRWEGAIFVTIYAAYIFYLLK